MQFLSIECLFETLPENEYHERKFNGEYFTLESLHDDRKSAEKCAAAWLKASCAEKYRIIKYKRYYGLYILH
jgi:hypothetical protein